MYAFGNATGELKQGMCWCSTRLGSHVKAVHLFSKVKVGHPTAEEVANRYGFPFLLASLYEVTSLSTVTLGKDWV